MPQLGAPGIAAHEVQMATGFRVVYGPVRAEDLPAFLDARMKATPEMRRVRFDLRDRLLLVPGRARHRRCATRSRRRRRLLALGGLGSRGYSLASVAHDRA